MCEPTCPDIIPRLRDLAKWYGFIQTTDRMIESNQIINGAAEEIQELRECNQKLTNELAKWESGEVFGQHAAQLCEQLRGVLPNWKRGGEMNFTAKRIAEARGRAAMAAMVDIDTFLAALDDIEYLASKVIITDTNGQYCAICNGQDDDYEGVIHKAGCPLEDGLQ
jgi:hypothetical protein